ncbi:MAG: ABC transporter permease, partial [Betaproteobacteria bacterium]|nr:ABC transporter permease [Betaproteobacteria bacterium]
TVFGGVGNILMGAIGGVMVPKFIMPPAMQALTIASPMAWALEGFHTIMLRGGGLADIVLPISALLVMAVVVLLLAVTLNLRYRTLL